MNIIENYQITEKLYESKNSLVYRAILPQDNRLIIAKILKENFPTPSELTRYKQEYEIVRSFQSDRIIKAYGLQRYENSLVMFLEDFGAQSLKIFMSKERFSLKEFLEIAIEITAGIDDIHANNIIHKDINPANIVYNRETKQLKIIDFGIATRLSRENQVLRNLNKLEGTLAYISPEQTGRMNRGIDYRSDFYSLGITFYELLTHQLPFELQDPMQLVHCHIAQRPIPPHELIPTIPLMVSDIVMNLLAKMPEERYQSARGLKADLEICLEQLRSPGNIVEFTLREQDICDRFQIPEKLYGREKEIAQLLSIFDRVSQGQTEMMLVSGYSGIGKSALVNEIQKPIVRQNGYFISGKFDQLQRDIPYAAISQAFRNLVRQLLTEPEETLQVFKDKLLEQLKPNAQIIIDLIPELEQIIGKQPPVEQLNPTEAQNRFNLFFQRFVNVFTIKERPLVIFLDDLQWADLSSLKLLEQLVTAAESQYLLMIGAYRDNEVDSTHPLRQTVEQLEKTKINITEISLKNLTIDCIEQLISDTLKCFTKASNNLARLLLQKTQGNPFFLNQLFCSLSENNLLLFDKKQGSWQWDIEKIKEVAITDNVVDLMIRKIEKLHKDTQEVLKIAACIGNQFNLDILAAVSSKSQIKTARELQPALSEGLIIPINDNYRVPLLWNEDEISQEALETNHSFIPEIPQFIPYKFLHDRVQQAAYALIPEEHKKAFHLQIGRLLYKNTQSHHLEDKIFDIVNQLNEGIDLIVKQPERDELAELNLKAGTKARRSTAYESALKYLEISLAFLSTNSWQEKYNLTLEVHLELLQVYYLNAKFSSVKTISDIVFNQAQNILDMVKVYEVNILSYYAQFKTWEATNTAIECLEKLGIQINQQKVLSENGIAKRLHESEKFLSLLLQDKQIEDLARLPTMTDPYKLAAISILQQVMTATWTTNYPLYVEVVLTQLHLCLQYNNSPQAAATYACYGMLLCGEIRDINTGYKFGQLSIDILERFNLPKLKPLVMHVYYGFIWHWKNHLRNELALTQLLQGFQTGIETGSYDFGGSAIISYCLIKLLAGYPLKEVQKHFSKYAKAVNNLQIEYLLLYIKIAKKISDYLLDENINNEVLIIGSDQEEEDKYLKEWKKNNNDWLLFISALVKTICFYFFKKYQKSIQQGDNLKQYIQACSTYLPAPQAYFYFSLALLAYYPQCHKEEQAAILEKVENNQEKIREWASYCVDNFQHKYDLVEAEKARVLGDYWQAENLYEEAIKGAKKYEFIHEEALAYERAAEFYLSLNRQEIGNLYLRNSHHCYSRWGAKVKARQLEEEYPQLFVKTSVRNPRITSDIISTTGRDTSESLDLNTVIKASQVLAGEIQLDKLLEKLMSIAIENAGAQKGLLILKRDRNWVIEAQRSLNSQETTTLQSIPIDSPNPNQPPLLSPAIANYVIHSQETVLLNDAVNEGQYTRDPYIIANQPKSILCTPLINQGKLSGILYLENNLTTNAFTSDRVELLRTLSTQAAISIENARLYQQLEEYNQTLEQQVAERTEQLQHKNEELAQTLQKLKTTQNELIQSEKMAALGQLVAGIAHEINTPLGAIRAAIGNTEKALQASLSQIPQLLPQLNPQQQTDFFSFLEQSLQSQPSLSTREKRQIKRTVTQHLESHDIANAQQLAHLLTEGGLHKNFESQLSLLQTPQAYQIVQIAYDIARLHANSQNINNAVERAAKIVFALKSYARYDQSGEKQSFQVTDGIETVLELYQNYLKKGVEVVRRYQPVPEIPGYPDELVQVWTNLIHNAIQAMEGKGILEIGVRQQEGDLVVEVTDSGSGIPPEIADKIFQPFFTTKPVGEGSGLGLDIVRKIIEKHQGTITFASVPGHTTFTVVLPRQ